MEHDTLAVMRLGGLTGLRCLGAPSYPKVIFVALFREPASRILSALHFYDGFSGGVILSSGPRSALRQEVLAARRWIKETPCDQYTADGVNRSMASLAKASTFELIGAGTIMEEYSHYFNIATADDVPAVLERLRREFVVGVTEDMAGLIDTLVTVYPDGPVRESVRAKMRGALAARPQKSGKEGSLIMNPHSSRAKAALANGLLTGMGGDGHYCSSKDVPRAVL